MGEPIIEPVEPAAIVEPVVEPVIEPVAKEYQWRELIDEDLATSASLEKFNGKPVGEVIKSYINLEKKLGGNPIVKPGEGATEDQWSEFYSQLGRPAEADQYELPSVDAPEGFTPSPEYEKAFKQAAFKAGASEKAVAEQWKALIETAIKDYTTAIEGNRQRLTESHDALKKEWGAAYPEKIELANRAASRAGGQELLEWMKKTGADKETMLIKAFAEFGAGLKEDTIGKATAAPSLTPKEAQSKVDKIMANKEHPYNNKTSPGHDEAISEVADLYKFMYPDKETNRTGDSDSYKFGVR